MTKGRGSARNPGGYRLSPINTQAVAQYPMSAQYTPLSSHPMSSHDFSHSPLQPSMSQQSYIQQPAYAQGGPVQAIPHPQYAIMTSAPRNVSARSSSSSWDRDADKLLMEARARDMNWGPIQQAYFPNKSANACRKRHERLMSKRNAAQCSGEREERIAHSYITLRKETWSPIAAQTGEKWHVVEQKVCYSNHKTLSSAGPNMSRRSSPKVLRTFNYRHVPTHAEWQPAMEGPSGPMKTPVCLVWMSWRLSTRMGLQTTALRRAWVFTISSRTSPILVNSRQGCTTAHMQGAAWSKVPKVRSALADNRHGCRALIPLSMATMFGNKSSKK